MMFKTICALLVGLIQFSAFSQHRIEVFFEFDRCDLKASEQQKLDAWIAQNPNAEIVGIYGYCDRIGTLAYNDSLSIKRAGAVNDYLRKSGLAFARHFEVRGYGEDFVQAPIRSENRKAVVRYRFPKPEAAQTVKSELSKTVENAKIGEKIKLPNLNFYNMSDEIVPNSRPVLDDLLALMQQNPKLRIEVQGHICCQTNSEKDYTYVSTMRAKAVYDYLARNGIDRSRIAYKGFGVSRPLHPIPEKNEQQQNENRRVEIEIVEN